MGAFFRVSVRPMIVFNLHCSENHAFEGWFPDTRAFESQRRARKIACPVCGDTRVRKALSAPNVATGERREQARKGLAREAKQMREALAAVHRHISETCEDVGPRFAEEARKIYYGETEARGIYGEASTDEAVELHDEGVPFTAIPKLPEGDA